MGHEYHVSDQIRMSPNEKIGVLPPGPISNHELFENSNDGEHELRSGLQVNRDYRGVNKEVW